MGAYYREVRTSWESNPPSAETRSSDVARFVEETIEDSIEKSAAENSTGVD